MTKHYTREEIKHFYENFHKLSSDGCYNIHVPTWEAMLKQDPNYCCKLEVEYKMKKIKEKFDEFN